MKVNDLIEDFLRENKIDSWSGSMGSCRIIYILEKSSGEKVYPWIMSHYAVDPNLITCYPNEDSTSTFCLDLRNPQFFELLKEWANNLNYSVYIAGAGVDAPGPE